jgi:hypothetical protein
MTHVTDLELLAIAEGQVPAIDDRHLEVCADCREKLAGLRDALQLAAAVDIPEPSPLFWEHFSSRVRSSLDDVEPGSATGWRTWILGSPFKVATAVAVVVLVAIGGTIWRTAPDPATERPDMILGTAGSGSTGATPAAPIDLDVEADGAWALVRDAADDVSWEDAVAAGWIVSPGSADDAVSTLTAEERGELVQLLRAEAKRAGA